MPTSVQDVLYRPLDNVTKRKRKVFFNDAVDVRFFHFTVDERKWRVMNIGSTARLKAQINAKYNERRRLRLGESACAAPILEPRQRLRLLPNRWMGDTGASWHMVSEREIDMDTVKNAVPVDQEIWLDTAQGPLKATRKVELRHDSLPDGGIQPLLMTKSPAVLSIGKFCMEHGFGFYWLPSQFPYLLSPSGERIDFDVVHNVPFLNIEELTNCPEGGSARWGATPAFDDIECRPCGSKVGYMGPSWDGFAHPASSSSTKVFPATGKFHVEKSKISADAWTPVMSGDDTMIYVRKHPATRVYRTADPSHDEDAPLWKNVDKVVTRDFKSGKIIRILHIDHSQPYNWDVIHGPIDDGGVARYITTELHCKFDKPPAGEDTDGIVTLDDEEDPDEMSDWEWDAKTKTMSRAAFMTQGMWSGRFVHCDSL